MGVFLLLLLNCCEFEPERPFLSPALDVVVTGSESALCVHRDGKVDFVLYHAAPVGNWSWNGSSEVIEAPHLWNERGHLGLYRTYHRVDVVREGTKPNELILNDRSFDLSCGRIFRITDSQTFAEKPSEPAEITFDQIALETGAIKSEIDLALFSEKLLDYLSKR